MIAIFAGHRAHVGEQRWFYRNDQEWSTIAEQLKLTPCPHCRAVGTLNRHGSLRGYDDGSPQRPTVRARRIFCSNRQARPGCGRTFSVWLADKIRRLSLTTGTLGRFLGRAVAGSIRAAIHATRQLTSHVTSHATIGAADRRPTERTWQRIWTRFDHGQSKIRTALSGRCPPPELPAHLPAERARQPAAQVLAHLQTAFPDAACPIAAFQHALRIFFI